MLSTIFNWIINNLLQSTPIIIGLVVVIGLVAQKKTFGQIIQGFIKCIIGYQIFVMGIGAFCGVINYMQAMMFTWAVGISLFGRLFLQQVLQ